MQGKTRWITGTAVAGTLLLGATLATGASAQTPAPGAARGGGYCPGFGMMSGGFGPRAAANTGTYGAGCQWPTKKVTSSGQVRLTGPRRPIIVEFATMEISACGRLPNAASSAVSRWSAEGMPTP